MEDLYEVKSSRVFLLPRQYVYAYGPTTQRFTTERQLKAYQGMLGVERLPRIRLLEA